MRIQWNPAVAPHIASMGLRLATQILEYEGHVPPEIVSEAQVIVGVVKRENPLACGRRECSKCRKYLAPLPDCGPGTVTAGLCMSCVSV